MKYADLVNRSTTTQMVSNPLEVYGRPATKSIVIVPFPLRNEQSLKLTTRPQMLGIYLLGAQAMANKVSNIWYHATPPVMLPQITIHLRCARIYIISRPMGFGKYQCIKSPTLRTQMRPVNLNTPAVSKVDWPPSPINTRSLRSNGPSRPHPQTDNHESYHIKKIELPYKRRHV